MTNVTFSKAAQPFQNSLTGLDSVGTAQFGGTTDAVAIDSRGSIGWLKFAKGLGNPAGVSTNPIYYGTPASQYGYPASGQRRRPGRHRGEHRPAHRRRPTASSSRSRRTRPRSSRA